MLKMLQSPYRAGMRGSNWLKLKREYQNELGDSLDLIVVGVYFVIAFLLTVVPGLLLGRDS